MFLIVSLSLLDDTFLQQTTTICQHSLSEVHDITCLKLYFWDKIPWKISNHRVLLLLQQMYYWRLFHGKFFSVFVP